MEKGRFSKYRVVCILLVAKINSKKTEVCFKA